MRFLDWNQFDECVEKISSACCNETLNGVYGVPRGGLCLAVALSHSLGIPLLMKPIPGSLLIDDIYETGTTILKFKEIPQTITYVWISKIQPVWWRSVEIDRSSQWYVFPWEDKRNAIYDIKKYRNSRFNI